MLVPLTAIISGEGKTTAEAATSLDREAPLVV